MDETRGPYHSFGNGSAMRVSAVAYVARSSGDALELAAQSAAVTHNHPKGIEGAQAIALATFLARQGADKDGILRAVMDHTSYDLAFDLDDIRQTYTFDATCQGSVPQTLVAFREGVDFEDTLRRAISIGGDSDTVACMAGAIAGPFHSVPQGINHDVRARLNERLNGVLSLFDQKFIDR